MTRKKMNNENAIELFLRVMNKVINRNRIPFDLGTGEQLFMGEIHTIEAIGETSEINVTELSKKLGVTKGAVSQMISRLLSKKMVKKYKSTAGTNEILLVLTDKGKEIRRAHKQYHREEFGEIFKGISPGQVKMIISLLMNIEARLDTPHKAELPVGQMEN